MRLSELTTWPNLITLYRVIVAIPIVLLLLDGSMSALWLALILMVGAEISDALDGWTARRLQLVSDVGKILDPLADSFYRVSVFAAFAANRWMPVWILLVMLWRDVGVAWLRVVAETSKGTLGARNSGKWKAISQGVAQLLVVLAYAVWGASLPGGVATGLWVALIGTTLVTAYSLLDYTVDVLGRRQRE